MKTTIALLLVCVSAIATPLIYVGSSVSVHYNRQVLPDGRLMVVSHGSTVKNDGFLTSVDEHVSAVPRWKQVVKYRSGLPESSIFVADELIRTTYLSDGPEVLVFHNPDVYPVEFGFRQLRIGVELVAQGTEKRWTTYGGWLVIDNRAEQISYDVETFWRCDNGVLMKWSIRVPAGYKTNFEPDLSQEKDGIPSKGSALWTLDSVMAWPVVVNPPVISQ